MKSHPTSIRLPKDILEKLDALAASNQLQPTRAQLVIAALKQYLSPTVEGTKTAIQGLVDSKQLDDRQQSQFIRWAIDAFGFAIPQVGRK